MPPKNAAAMNALMEALRRTATAHEDVRQGIATHAEKHRASMHEAREKMAREAKINEGIARANSSLYSARQVRNDVGLWILAGNILGRAGGGFLAASVREWY